MKSSAAARNNPCETFTATGKRLDFLRPRPEDIDRESIAHHLSLLNRWTGNTHFAYSVAQHSLLVADLIPVPEWRIYGLLHDAAEAYTGDLPTPLKYFITRSGMDFFTLERRILNAVYAHFKLPLPTREIADAVDWADDQALATEYRDAVKGTHPTWNPPANPHTRVIKFMPGIDAQCRFLEVLDLYLAMHNKAGASAGVR
jgi:5'-nucleotidase